MKPEWMPPLPAKQVVYTQMPDDYRYGHKYAHTAKQMRDYALAAVEAYKASLKPVAYRSRWPEVEHAKAWEYIDMFVPRPEHGRVIEPLYRLDGGDDEQV
jgi:hypothetical protein